MADPQLPPGKKEIADRLRQLANDCEERARLSDSAEGRNLYHLTARGARQAADAKHMADSERRSVLIAMTAQSIVARWHDGESLAGDEIDGLVNCNVRQRGSIARKTSQMLASPADIRSEIPPSALNARQLGERFGMQERTVRRAIERGVRMGWPGHYRHGCHWYAEPGTFDQARRQLSELCPNVRAGLYSGHDEADYSPPLG